VILLLLVCMGNLCTGVTAPQKQKSPAAAIRSGL
jgi:hypothetical protein